MLLARKQFYGEAAAAQLRLAEPTLLLPGDRLSCGSSRVVTVGGGVVLDASPIPRGMVGFDTLRKVMIRRFCGPHRATKPCWN